MLVGLIGIGIAALFLSLIAIVIIKMVYTRKLPSLYYTPFDNVTGHTRVEFHEQKEEREDEDGQGDDKEKHLIKLK